MSDKDRFGDKMRDLEKAQEDQWARQRDQELLEKLRGKQQADLHCPRCGKPLVARPGDGVALMVCPDNEGAWIDAGDLAQFLAKAR